MSGKVTCFMDARYPYHLTDVPDTSSLIWYISIKQDHLLSQTWLWLAKACPMNHRYFTNPAVFVSDTCISDTSILSLYYYYVVF